LEIHCGPSFEELLRWKSRPKSSIAHESSSTEFFVFVQNRHGARVVFGFQHGGARLAQIVQQLRHFFIVSGGLSIPLGANRARAFR
jgi:hypothetical protein